MNDIAISDNQIIINKFCTTHLFVKYTTIRIDYLRNF